MQKIFRFYKILSLACINKKGLQRYVNLSREDIQLSESKLLATSTA